MTDVLTAIAIIILSLIGGLSAAILGVASGSATSEWLQKRKP